MPGVMRMGPFITIVVQIAATGQAPTTPPPDVVVNGPRLEQAYRECATARCTALRDAQVSIAFAEDRFRRGAYLSAKSILAAAAERNRRRAATDPRPVAAIYEAYATAALHEGDERGYRRAVGGRMRTAAYLTADDPARTAAALATGDMWLSLGETRNALRIYARVEERAREAGDARGELLAVARRAWVTALRGETGEARGMIRAAATTPAARDPQLRAILQVIELRIAARDADGATVDALIAQLGDVAAAPTLLISPAYEPAPDQAAQRAAARFGELQPFPTRPSDYSGIRWADIGFWIDPDGRTRDAEVLRGVGRDWTGAALRQIAGRRYAGVSDGAGPGVYRVERFTSRGTYVTPTGSLVERRAGPRKLIVAELSDAGTNTSR